MIIESSGQVIRFLEIQCHTVIILKIKNQLIIKVLAQHSHQCIFKEFLYVPKMVIYP